MNNSLAFNFVLHFPLTKGGPEVVPQLPESPGLNPPPAALPGAMALKAKQDEAGRVSNPCAPAPALKGAEKTGDLAENALGLSINPISPQDTPREDMELGGS
ncbi:hypothetical protein PTTG_01937 [Puccinia triticina 1-1 BBBD Race 1]|uniref:Uncharacterized protein n=1 Tax=Puccinia triticina (isolate 1-1 / race 1 (BBBD)) TaxID=630390 RepID=A0A180GBV7_PUCT1|nr:hypothetical protein PTTG_01937 [Puccinia triticina 1-1 BBBD Race 1]